MLIQFSEIRGAERVKKVTWKRTNLDLHKRNKSSIRIISSVKINVFRKELIFKCPIIVFLAFLLLFLWFYQFHLKKTYPYMWKENYSSSLREKCPNTEFFPVRIWIISRSVFTATLIDLSLKTSQKLLTVSNENRNNCHLSEVYFYLYDLLSWCCHF